MDYLDSLEALCTCGQWEPLDEVEQLQDEVHRLAKLPFEKVQFGMC